MGWRGLWPYALAFAVLLGATAYMLDRSPKYPGRCDCVARVPKRWWEIWQ